MDDPRFGDQTDPGRTEEHTSAEWIPTDPDRTEQHTSSEPMGSLDVPGDPDSEGEAPVDPDSAAGSDGSGDPQPEREGILDEMECELADVEHALTRLRDGTYGRCETCGEPIPDPVLAASPASRWCRLHGHVGASSVPT